MSRWNPDWSKTTDELWEDVYRSDRRWAAGFGVVVTLWVLLMVFLEVYAA